MSTRQDDERVDADDDENEDPFKAARRRSYENAACAWLRRDAENEALARAAQIRAAKREARMRAAQPIAGPEKDMSQGAQLNRRWDK